MFFGTVLKQATTDLHFSNWQLATLWLTDKLSQAAPTFKHASLDSWKQTKTKQKQKTWPCCFRKQEWSAVKLCKSNRDLEITWCCLRRLSKWGKLPVPWREVHGLLRGGILQDDRLTPRRSIIKENKALLTRIYKSSGPRSEPPSSILPSFQ